MSHHLTPTSLLEAVFMFVLNSVWLFLIIYSLACNLYLGCPWLSFLQINSTSAGGFLHYLFVTCFFYTYNRNVFYSAERREREQNSLGVSNELVKVELLPWKIWKAGVSSTCPCKREGLGLEMSASQIFHGANSTFICSWKKNNKFSCFNLPQTQHHGFFTN